MEYEEMRVLIEKAIQPDANQTWADLGAGDGAFAIALRKIAGPQVIIYLLDTDTMKLAAAKETFRTQFGASYEIGNRHFLETDFTKFKDFPPLDGILMANTLHFIKDQSGFLRTVSGFLKPNGKLLVVEYDTNQSNPFIPYPLPFQTFARFAQAVGFAKPTQLATVPSKYQGTMYSAMAMTEKTS